MLGGLRTADGSTAIMASSTPSLAPTGTFPGVPIGAPPAAGLFYATGRSPRTLVTAVLRPRAKLRRRRGVREDAPKGGLRNMFAWHQFPVDEF